MMKCSQCGMEVEEAKFCTNCGAPLSAGGTGAGQQQESGAGESSEQEPSSGQASGSAGQEPLFGQQFRSEGQEQGFAQQPGSAGQEQGFGQQFRSEGQEQGFGQQPGNAGRQQGFGQQPGNAGRQYGGAGQSGGLDAVKIFSAVFAVIFAIYAVRNLFFGVLGGVLRIFAGYFWRAGLFGSLVSVALSLMTGVAFAAMAALMAVILKSWKKSDSGAYLISAGVGGVVLVLISIMRMLFYLLVYREASTSSFILLLLFLTLNVGGLFILFTMAGAEPLDRIHEQGFANAVQGSVYETIDLAKAAFTGKGGSAQGANSGGDHMQNGYDGNGQMQQMQMYGNAGGAPGNGMPLKTDRSLPMFILLSLVTCGIYSFFYVYSITEDVNVACAGDGKETTGFLKYLVFSVLTCGIYSLYWHYCFCNRLSENAPRYGLHFEENGTTYLLWTIFGSILCGVGYYIAVYIQMKNLNALCAAYNRANGLA